MPGGCGTTDGTTPPNDFVTIPDDLVTIIRLSDLDDLKAKAAEAKELSKSLERERAGKERLLERLEAADLETERHRAMLKTSDQEVNRLRNIVPSLPDRYLAAKIEDDTDFGWVLIDTNGDFNPYAIATTLDQAQAQDLAKRLNN